MARVTYRDPIAPAAGTPPPRVNNIGRALANSPGAARHSNATAMYIRHQSKLDPRLRELAILQVGYSARSPYEYAHHVEIALSFGVTEADIRAIADDTAGRPTHFDALSRAALRAAREMTENVALSDATFAELRKALDDEQLVDLLFAIATYNGVVRILAALMVDLEDDYRPFLERFPLPAAGR
jgi:alkylhydroperoxidase family enzyme